MRPLRPFLCAAVVAASVPAAADEPDVVVADFERDSYSGWAVEGEAFGGAPVRGDRLDVAGYRGRRFANSFHGGDGATGSLASEPFEITRDHLAFLIGGGNHPGETGIELLVDGKAVRTATGSDSGTLRWYTWDVRPFRGKRASVRLFDRATGAWGHINVDQVVLTDRPRTGAGTWRLEDYRRSDEYYREPFRPGYHFTPELNWTNDPNGLIWFDGEWHLFYQHNPHGNRWGHMSWGHAVSPDLVRWEHLPIALHEEYGVMAFSGSCVYDRENTSGFGTQDRPPLVAIYTGHGHGRQTQDLAYSLDRGRTWTKYPGNPVLDIGEADFRDPKVFRHEPTGRWVMVVSLAVQKKIRFYGSQDLKDWTLLSEFGPAGVEGKPNWECPDLFELPIEGEPGQTRWVLEADMGGGAVAGGSGGEYFVGTFDGTTFTPDRPESRWVDYGRDFYAPITFANVPESDGRRVWIGWMNNWETNLVPTDPWRGAMSLPRRLGLKRTRDGLVLTQRPVKELETIRGGHVSTGPVDLKESSGPVALPLEGQRMEIVVEFDAGTAAEFGLRVLKGEGEETVVGYDAKAGKLFVDRTRSGVVDFHPAFPGRHAGPLAAEDGRVRLHVFVDSCSVEVFGGDGTTVITDLVFPGPESDAVEFYAKGGDCRVVSCEAWKLEPVWAK
ncbi:MAG TPA: glycoside hydrolase family 32 protein [Planctomycetaceae bacterium]